jgi:hypothetical protein
MQQRENDKKNICILRHNKKCDSNNLSVPKSDAILTYKTHVGPEMKVFQLCFQTTRFWDCCKQGLFWMQFIHTLHSCSWETGSKILLLRCRSGNPFNITRYEFSNTEVSGCERLGNPEADCRGAITMLRLFLFRKGRRTSRVGRQTSDYSYSSQHTPVYDVK